MDNLINLSRQLGQLLKEKNAKLVLAESCTGGLACATISDIAGSSAWFDRGFITYSNAAKQDMLNVTTQTLSQFGAVSEETAKEMALGALNNSDADIAVSITGIAGPDGGSIDKPVGTVCFAYAIKNGYLTTMTKHLIGTRQEIRYQSVVHVMNELIILANNHLKT
jgi:nicotinamide-nucleotide amidase